MDPLKVSFLQAAMAPQWLLMLSCMQASLALSTFLRCPKFSADLLKVEAKVPGRGPLQCAAQSLHPCQDHLSTNRGSPALSP